MSDKPTLSHEDHASWRGWHDDTLELAKQFLFVGQLYRLSEFDCVVLDTPKESFRLEGLSSEQRDVFSGQSVRIRGTISEPRDTQAPPPPGQPLRSIAVEYIEECKQKALALIEVATAIDTLERLVRDKRTDIRLLNDLGYAYFRASLSHALGNRSILEKGLTVLQRALEINPRYAVAYNNLALIHTVLGNFQRVLELCNRALDLDPQYTTPYFGIYCAHSQLGDAHKARRALERVLEIGGDSANVSHARLLLKRKAADQTITCTIVSCKDALVEQYGEATFAEIDRALEELAKVHCEHGIDSTVAYVELPPGIELSQNERASRIKSRIDALCRDARRRGDPVEYIIIVGAERIVPFFELSDPTDGDGTLLSDNPYSSDEETVDDLIDYLLPSRRVGRIPGEDGTADPSLLLAQIRNAIRYHQNSDTPAGRVFCYSAEAWLAASRVVLEPLQDWPVVIKSSEPLREADFETSWLEHTPYVHFNLHGQRNDESWKGTGKPAWKMRSAFGPHNLNGLETDGAVVFAQCCYGAYITGKDRSDSVSLALLDRGVRCFVGSLAVAYGVDGVKQSELEESDLVARSFWKYVREGLRLGEALLRARRDFAETMAIRAGGLDDDDQKTLLSFVMYGDPTLNMVPAS
ncbi:MAG: tetratricopeptide repeat protein [Gammaproteobacteria bacterium]|nr:tetratricopeptide repeat protein [Gammaproteobacteria bacterium]